MTLIVVFCDAISETTEHLFFYCRHTQNLWSQVENWTKTVFTDITFDIKTVLFGYNTFKYAPINLIILLVKQYIFQQSRKNREMSFSEVKEKITYEYLIEKTRFSLKFESTKFETRWSPFRALFEN